MVFLYDLGIRFYTFIIGLASLKNAKAKAWLAGRKNLLKKISKELNPTIRYTWFHFASLGEFEQGRSVMEHLKATKKDIHILITFFSPSGYEIRKNYPLADHVFYLPSDTATHAREFVRLVNPAMAVFTKYEYWYHYFDELHKNQIPLYVISAIFRKNQPFFQFYGGLHRRMLQCVSHFFVQNEESKLLLQTLSINHVTVSGDTRFDRVAENASHPKSFDFIKSFCGEAQVLVAGSTWPADEKLLAQLIKQHPDWKLIIAPHEISEEKINALEALFDSNSTIRYSVLDTQVAIRKFQYAILIIDNIGMLSSLYQYGCIAYIGGGFGSGIHNTLEAAAFGLPILFGPNYYKFQEAKDMIDLGAAFSIKNISEFEIVFDKMGKEDYLTRCERTAKAYVKNHTGATARIIQHILDH
jgi:3-deoxy-D-manno-octulosonic-acid transferase